MMTTFVLVTDPIKYIIDAVVGVGNFWLFLYFVYGFFAIILVRCDVDRLEYFVSVLLFAT